MKLFLLLVLQLFGDSLSTNIGSRIYQYTNEGSTMTLICKLNQTSASTSAWHGPPNVQLYARGATINPKLQNYNRLSITGDGVEEYNLQISNFSKEDEGAYHCSTDASKMSSIRAQVTRPPKNMTINGRMQQHSIIYCIEKQVCNITCRVDSGVPKENMTLTKDLDTQHGGPGVISMDFLTSKSDHMKKITCMAFTNDRKGSLELTANLHVYFLPTAEIINGSLVKIKEGHKLNLKCNSVSSNTETTVAWTKQTDIHLVDNSIFTVNKVGREDAGNYTCTVENKVGLDKDTVVVIVEYVPDIFIGVQILKEYTRLSCVGKGVPDRYNFSNWEHRSFYGDHIRYLSAQRGTNHSVSFIDIGGESEKHLDRGIYICTVSNGIPDSTGASLVSMEYSNNVSGKPYFVTENKEIQYGILTRTAVIKVYFVSFPKPSTISFLRDTEGVERNIPFGGKRIPVNDTIYNMTVRVQGYQTSVDIPVEEADDFTSYEFEIKNTFGSSSYVVRLASANKPETPSHFIALAKQQSIEISWKPEFDGGYTQSFVVEVQTGGQKDWTPYEIGFAARAMIDGLEADTYYNVRMFSKNMIGASNVTDAVQIKTGKSFPYFIIYGCIGVLIVVICIACIKRLYFSQRKGICKVERNGNIQIHYRQEQGEDGSGNIDDVCVYSSMDRRGKYSPDSLLNSRTAKHTAIEEIQGVTPATKITSKCVEGSNSQRKDKGENSFKQGNHLNYVKVHFDSKSVGRRFVIHGKENRTPYADIDLSIKADPLPSSESEHESSEEDISVQKTEGEYVW